MTVSFINTTNIKELEGLDYLENILLYINNVATTANSTKSFLKGITAPVPDNVEDVPEISAELLDNNLKYIEANLIKPMNHAIQGIKDVVDCYNSFSGLRLQQLEKEEDFEDFLEWLESLADELEDDEDDELSGVITPGDCGDEPTTEEILEEEWEEFYDSITDTKAKEIHNNVNKLQEEFAENEKAIKKIKQEIENLKIPQECIGNCKECSDTECNYREEPYKESFEDFLKWCSKDFGEFVKELKESAKGKGKGKNKSCSGDCLNCTSCSGH